MFFSAFFASLTYRYVRVKTISAIETSPVILLATERGSPMLQTVARQLGWLFETRNQKGEKEMNREASRSPNELEGPWVDSTAAGSPGNKVKFDSASQKLEIFRLIDFEIKEETKK
jgi:hypothetical protein